MTVTDSVADMLVRIKTGIIARKEAVDIPHSKFKESIAKVLKDEGYILSYEALAKGAKKTLRIWFKLRSDGKQVIRNLKRISRPGSRTYQAYKKMFSPMAGFGTLIVSTPKGVMTEKQARKIRVGGEVLCQIT